METDSFGHASRWRVRPVGVRAELQRVLAPGFAGEQTATGTVA
jgi:hypothetical protein